MAKQHPPKGKKGQVDKKRGKAAAKPPADDAQPPSSEILDMNQAIELLKTSRPTFYRWLRSGKIKGFKIGRQWRFYRQDIERFLHGQEPRIDLAADISPLIETLAARLRELGVQPAADHDNDTVRAAALMIRLAVEMRASDLHIEPHRVPDGDATVARIRCRVDGVLHPVAEFDIRLLPAIVERWILMADCYPHEKVRPQDGRILVRLPDTGKNIDLRVSFLPAQLGPSLCARVLDRDAVRLDLDRIPFADRDRAALVRAIEAPWGLVLVAGPTGSGKTTTFYACLSHLATPERKLISIEDPVEFLLPGVLQVPLRAHQGVTFAVAVRSALRAAVDVMLVGEIRDHETLQLCHQAALTGHVVFSTLHADEAARALIRMVEIGSDPFLVADATRLIVAQRLVRLLCRECSTESQPPMALLEQAAQIARTGGVDWTALPRTYRQAQGCPRCNQTGYRGRTVVAEALEVTPQIGEALRRGAGVDELRTLAVGQGMTTMAADGIRRAATGETSLDEALRVV